MPEREFTIEKRGRKGWSIEVKRQCDGSSATGKVVVRQSAAPDESDPPHIALAGSRAWLTLGAKMLEAGDAKAAIRCAQEGLDELGDSYFNPEVEDDTDQKLMAAKELVRDNRLEDGARLMLRMLRTRANLYAGLYNEEIAG